MSNAYSKIEVYYMCNKYINTRLERTTREMLLSPSLTRAYVERHRKNEFTEICRKWLESDFVELKHIIIKINENRIFEGVHFIS